MAVLKMIATGNEEFDLKIGGGLPHPSLLVIEGGHGSGKTALSLLFLRGALASGLQAVAFTSESRPADYVRKATLSGFPIEGYYIRGSLRVYSIQYPGPLDREIADLIAERLNHAIKTLSSEAEFFVIDSISYFGSIATPSLLNEFIATLRDVSIERSSVIVTVHPGSLPEDVSTRLYASADAYFKTSSAVIGGRRLKVLSIVKFRGAPPGIETTITFDVDPAFGIKIVPIMVSQA